MNRETKAYSNKHSKDICRQPIIQNHLIAPENDSHILMKSNGLSSFCPCGGACPICKKEKDGNFVTPLQPTLKISEPDDPLERDADRVAEKIMISTTAFPEQIDSSKTEVQTYPRDKAYDFISAAATEGSKLNSPIKKEMESKFGFNLDNIRVHTGNLASLEAKSYGARAFTLGSNIFFDEREYRPDTYEGKRLLAHEITHVVQQQGTILGNYHTPINQNEMSHRPSNASHRGPFNFQNMSEMKMPIRPSVHVPQGTILRQPVPDQRDPSAVLKNFGSEPDTRGLYVTIIGHASPRWIGASSSGEADRLNQELSERRTNTVRKLIERILGEKAGRDVKIVTLMDYGYDITSGALGSKESLVQAGGNRTRNDEYYRRVDVDVRFLSSKGALTSTGPYRKSAITRVWYLTIDTLTSKAIGAADAYVKLTLKNPISGKRIPLEADLAGGGIGFPSIRWNVGKKDAIIKTKDEMSFQDWYDSDMKGVFTDGPYVRITLFSAPVYKYIRISFPSLGKDATAKLEGGLGWGGFRPKGMTVSGKLRLYEPNLWLNSKDAGDFYYLGKKKYYTTQEKSRVEGGVILNFETGKDNLSGNEIDRLKEYMAIWAARLIGS